MESNPPTKHTGLQLHKLQGFGFGQNEEEIGLVRTGRRKSRGAGSRKTSPNSAAVVLDGFDRFVVKTSEAVTPVHKALELLARSQITKIPFGLEGKKVYSSKNDTLEGTRIEIRNRKFGRRLARNYGGQQKAKEGPGNRLAQTKKLRGYSSRFSTESMKDEEEESTMGLTTGVLVAELDISVCV
ncbi:hypothetical protein V1478_002820 [Vespula squamosa]|uniref:Uncharacterized protein n=1 Tax=Vespula squamosa TaxID=30214 RepID=A0ABD2BR72_VESSQ